ncbi:MAG: M23 family metallopeptidase [Eubacteriales bacterium]
MNNNNELPKIGKKGTVLGLVLCFVAMITLVGAYNFSQYRSNVQEQIAQNEVLDELELEQLEIIDTPAEEANTSNIINEETTMEEETNLLTENTLDILDEEVASVDEVTQETSTTNESVVNQVLFNDDGSIMWPISGDVILNYSMDESIYFETLNQYKRNPAMIIAGEVGTEVLAAERGIVASVDNFAETGNTVTLDMGNGYTAIYGQLEEIKVTEGNLVEKGQIMGVLAEPSKYYSLEGSNLYFQMLKDGEPVNPLEYLE